jgi:hypothetical protein
MAGFLVCSAHALLISNFRTQCRTLTGILTLASYVIAHNLRSQHCCYAVFWCNGYLTIQRFEHRGRHILSAS